MEKRFICGRCDFTAGYHYKGRQPPFANSIMLLEDCYIMKDPFSTFGGFITIGGNCSLCFKDVCVSADCSLFYTQRFCLKCAYLNLKEFPKTLQQEILSRTNWDDKS
ncbi:cysteine-rich dpf motif domain-containing protein 1 [Plakobranchus ocellatus]|uniref:Cysteine-rich DPF motif domain-containing protein 1 n=1 Tax=Plakobranchus ocellatus TaxID=259542 RepID=A0AAV4ADG4_9GAST|nr:cysteine-rich dpf motif domain-containing protein 1 [Plakobranchus ocellatus]